MIDILFSGERLKPFAGEIRQAIKALGEYPDVDAGDPVYGESFLNYWALSHPDALEKMGFTSIGEREALYSTYYWLLKFKKLYGLRHGPDPSLDTLLLRLLEYAEFEIDWPLMERIVKEVESDVGADI